MREKIKSKINGMLSIYDYIFVMPSKFGLERKMMTQIAKKYNVTEKILILVIDGLDELEFSENIVCKKISKVDMHNLCLLYHMYDFSDKICMVDNNERFGTLFNYLHTGILSEDEFIDAIV